MLRVQPQPLSNIRSQHYINGLASGLGRVVVGCDFASFDSAPNRSVLNHTLRYLGERACHLRFDGPELLAQSERDGSTPPRAVAEAQQLDDNGFKNTEVEDTKTHVIYRRETIGDLYK